MGLRCCFSMSLTRSRRRRRTRSSIGTVTSCHHSSVCTSWISAICSRTIGIADFSSSSPAIAFTWSRRRSKPGSARSTRELQVRASAGRTASPPRPPARSSDGSPATSCASSASASRGKRRPRLGLRVLLDERAASAGRRSCRGSSPRLRACSSCGDVARALRRRCRVAVGAAARSATARSPRFAIRWSSSPISSSRALNSRLPSDSPARPRSSAGSG